LGAGNGENFEKEYDLPRGKKTLIAKGGVTQSFGEAWSRATKRRKGVLRPRWRVAQHPRTPQEKESREDADRKKGKNPGASLVS